MKRLMVFMLLAVVVLGSVGLWSRLPVSAEASVHALWIFSDEVSTPAARDTLVQRSAASGVTDLYLSVYRSALNSAGRRMYEDSDIADLISKAHLHGLAVWAAYGNTDWPAIGCSPSSWPLQRMAEVVAYDTANPTARFDGVILDVEPPEPQSEAAYQSLLTLYQCTRAFLPSNLQLAAAIRFFWDTAVAFPVGGSVKPVYQHIADLNLDHIVVMGYRDFAGTAVCAEGDGLICLDQDEIAYADTLLKSNLILVGLETANCAPSECGPEKVTFYEEGQAALNSEAQLVATHFGGHISFGGFAIHRYNASYLSGLPAWPTENPPPPQGVIVKLLDSQGHGLAGASAQYYDAGWQTIPGSTDASGALVTDIPTTRGNLTFRMTYANASKDMAQNVTSNPIVTFQTAHVVVELRDSAGNLTPDGAGTGTVQYYAGGWRDFGATAGGQASKELLPLTYSFSMNYAFARQEKGGHNVAANPTVTFQTAHVVVELRDSAGNLMPDGAGTGTVQYYAGGWRDFGATAGGQASKELLPLTYSFSMSYAFARQEKGGQSVAANPTVTFQTAHVTVELRDSAGNLTPDGAGTGTVQYYAGGWRDFGATAGGQASKELLPLTYSFSMSYAFARQEKGGQNTAANPTVTFQTAHVTVELRDSAGNLMPDAAGTGMVQYYAGGWRDFGATAGGQASKELLPLTYSFSMSYAFARQEKGGQNTAANPTVTFQTAHVTVELRDSAGNLMPDGAGTGAVQYYAGGWRDFGATAGGQASKELLPLTYSFSMSYAFARQEKGGQNVAANPTVTFQTAHVTVELRDSAGNLMPDGAGTGAVQYYAGGWRTFGATAGGQASKELLPLTYSFSMSYAFARQEKGGQNTAANPTVTFQTAHVTVELRDSAGNLMPDGAGTGAVQYYAGGWRDFGATAGGQASKELLPLTYSFSMSYAFARQEKGGQNTAANPTVTFQTAHVVVELRDSAGNLMPDGAGTGTVQYYAGGWRDFGATAGGQASKELLPLTYSFSMSYAFARQEKGGQNTAASPTVTFQTGLVHSESGSAVQYYAGGWRSFAQDMQLLPGSYTFHFNDGNPNQAYPIAGGSMNSIH